MKLVLELNSAKSVRAIVSDLLAQAFKRQAEAGGTMFTATVLQHLVGAKLDIVMGEGVEHHGASVAGGVSDREAEFFVGDVAIHVTVAPNEALIKKCRRNLENGLRPLVITTQKSIPTAAGLADQAGIADRVDIFEAEQFIAGNFYRLGKFVLESIRGTAKELIARYNAIVEECECDAGLRIAMGE